MQRNEFNWCNEPVIGLILSNAKIDSNGNPIHDNRYYEVGKHKESGKLLINPTEKIFKYEKSK